MNWTDWLSFGVVPCHYGPAVYEFRLVVLGRPVAISRFLGVDEGGTLVYGCTGKFDQRYWQSRAAKSSANGSSTINLLYYWERFTALPKLYPNFAYQYRFAPLATKKEAKQHESALIKRYVCRFGDRPPLNSALPDRYAGWDEALASIEQALLGVSWSR
jgi:hypothetical protein